MKALLIEASGREFDVTDRFADVFEAVRKTDNNPDKDELLKWISKAFCHIAWDLLGGHYEVQATNDGRVIYMDDCGLLKKLPHNQKATAIYGKPVVGDVVVFDKEAWDMTP